MAKEGSTFSGLTGRTLGALVVASLAVAGAAAAEERAAQLSKVDGNVTIRRAAGATETARQQGPRVINGSVFAGDEVTTDAAASATILFTDGSAVDLKPKTSVTIREVDRSAEAATHPQQKRLGRVLKVLAGDVLAHVVPNPEIATEFETPSGVAAVKGTTLEISVR